MGGDFNLNYEQIKRGADKAEYVYEKLSQMRKSQMHATIKNRGKGEIDHIFSDIRI